MKKSLFWGKAPNGNDVWCKLCPRHCLIKENQTGFCKTRKNKNGILVALYYDWGLPLSIESIEAEAIYHYMPGSSILCIGNVGCMLRCSFCQNWETSQISYLDKSTLTKYTPKDIVSAAIEKNIQIISWTYNDPVVWHEFVIETSKYAKAYGIKVLYKSSLFIEIEPLRQLINYVDIFSISLKSLSDEFYRIYTKQGKLTPVLEGIKEIHNHKNKHMEISQLIVTGLNDSIEDIKATCSWIIDNIGYEIPLHIVGFHPAFEYKKVKRTSLKKIHQFCCYAKNQGIKYVYSGNTIESPFNHTYCPNCNGLLIKRIGTKSNNVALDKNGLCNYCKTEIPIKPNFSKNLKNEKINIDGNIYQTEYIWGKNESTIHLEKKIHFNAEIKIVRSPSGFRESYFLTGKLSRLAINRLDKNEKKIIIYHNIKLNILSLLDRAHYPLFPTAGQI